MEFASLSQEQKDYIENIDIDQTFITMHEIYDIRANLSLYDKSIDDLRAVRNAVVKHLSEKIETFEHDFKAGKKILNNMSAIVCVIDDMMFNMGCEV